MIVKGYEIKTLHKDEIYQFSQFRTDGLILQFLK
jgi:hypothetical protein